LKGNYITLCSSSGYKLLSPRPPPLC